MGFGAASTTTLAITVAITIVLPELLQDPSAALYATGVPGAAISLWWTFALFWREIKLVSGSLSSSESRKQIQPPTSDMMNLNVELPTVRWGQKSPVKMTATGGTFLADVISKAIRDCALQGGPFYVNIGKQTLGPEQYHQSLGTLGIRDGQKITLTDNPLMVRCKNLQCGHVHASMIQMTPESFRTSILRDNSEQCPKCGRTSTYNKDDYFFRTESSWR
jgi:hypothetical protein